MSQVERVQLEQSAGASDDGWSTAIAELEVTLSRLKSGQRETKVIIEIGTPPLQRRTLHGLPRVSRSMLGEMIARQAHRYFRPSASGLVIDAEWVASRSGPPDVVAVALDRPLASSIRSACAAASVTLVDIVPLGSRVSGGLSLLPEEEKESRRRVGRAATVRVARVTVGLWLLLVAAGIAAERMSHSRVEARLERLRPASLRVRDARSAMDSVAAMLDTIERGKARRLVLARVLDTLVASLPDSAVLGSIVLNSGGGGEISGLAQEPLRVLAELQRRRPNASSLNEPVAEPSGGRNWLRFAVRLDTALP